MRRERAVIGVLLLSVCFISPMRTAAVSNTTFSDSMLIPTDSEVSTEFLTEAEDGGYIQNFAVSDTGSIAICINSDCVNFYQKDGTFLYAVRYYSSGMSRVFWYKDNPVIYLVRGNLCLIPYEAHQSIEVWEFTGSESDLLSETVFTNCSVNGTFYQMLPSDSFLSRSKGYQLVMQNSGETQQVIYTDKKDARNAVFRLLLIIAVFLGTAVAIWKNIRLWRDLMHL
ncbi:MAG: hypothetical protein K5695_17825 [Oscillospiraceae bacterium]|nr:hypothetical protein [Oscillospiraceae bacterium]